MILNDNFCFECGCQNNIEMHHVVPKCKGGTKTVPLCANCHGKIHGIERLHISNLIKAALAAKKAKGGKLGTPANLTQQAREKGRKAHSENAANNPNTKQAKGYALMMRQTGATLQQVAAKLNCEGFKTARGGQYSAVQVQRLIQN